jgi:hypothetical protein
MLCQRWQNKLLCQFHNSPHHDGITNRQYYGSMQIFCGVIYYDASGTLQTTGTDNNKSEQSTAQRTTLIRDES